MHEKIVKWGIVSFILLVMSGCAIFAERKPEERVRERVNERWLALIDGRLETAYTYETPEYRELKTFVGYRKTIKGMGAWQKAEIEKIVCKVKKCSVDVRIYVKIKPGLGFDYVETNGQATEKWIQHSTTGKWYHVSDQ